MFASINNTFRKFHSDEEGLEALQVVMIIAIAGMVMVAAATIGQQIVDWMSGKVGEEGLQGVEISAEGGGEG